jgi:hypothetical protein
MQRKKYVRPFDYIFITPTQGQFLVTWVANPFDKYPDLDREVPGEWSDLKRFWGATYTHISKDAETNKWYKTALFESKNDVQHFLDCCSLENCVVMHIEVGTAIDAG